MRETVNKYRSKFSKKNIKLTTNKASIAALADLFPAGIPVGRSVVGEEVIGILEYLEYQFSGTDKPYAAQYNLCRW